MVAALPIALMMRIAKLGTRRLDRLAEFKSKRFREV